MAGGRVRPWVVVFAILAAGCGGSATDGVGGTVTVAFDTEPDVLNAARSPPAVTASIVGAVLASPYRVTPDLRYEPWLIAGEAELSDNPFSVTYRIRDEATWNDGTPVTARDFVFTWETLTNPEWNIVVRDPAARVERAEVIDARTVRFVYGEPYAHWRALFLREGVLPAHVLEGQDFNSAWNDALPVASGPLQLREWRRGDRLVLERNETYWGEPARLDAVVFRFITDTDTLPQALRAGEVDLAQVDPAVLPALGGADAVVSAAAGLRWEFVDMRTEAIPVFVRQAIAYAIDRDALVEVSARAALPDTPVLDSLVYLTGDDAYEPHFAAYAHDPSRAVALLEDHGCSREPDGVFACEGERLDYTMATVADRQRAELQFEIIQDQLSAVGIRVSAAFGDTPMVLEQLAQGRADLAGLSINLGWEPFWRAELLGCAASVGPSRYCNDEVSGRLDRGRRTLDPEEQARLYNEAGVLLAEDVPVLPLYQVPDVLARHARLAGVEHSLSGDPLAGIERWHLRD